MLIAIHLFLSLAHIKFHSIEKRSQSLATPIWHAYCKPNKNSIISSLSVALAAHSKKKKPNHHFVFNFLHKQCGQAENYAFDCRRELEKWQKFIIRCCLQIDFPLLNGCTARMCVCAFSVAPAKLLSWYVDCAANVYGKLNVVYFVNSYRKIVCAFFCIDTSFFFASAFVECSGEECIFKRMIFQTKWREEWATQPKGREREREKKRHKCTSIDRSICNSFLSLTENISSNFGWAYSN